MALTEQQITEIDEMIGNNKKRADIVNELVGKHGADARELDEYLKENKTVQGIINTITRRTKDVVSASDEASRKKAAKEIEGLSKKAIKMLKGKAGQ